LGNLTILNPLAGNVQAGIGGIGRPAQRLCNLTPLSAVQVIPPAAEQKKKPGESNPTHPYRGLPTTS